MAALALAMSLAFTSCTQDDTMSSIEDNFDVQATDPSWTTEKGNGGGDSNP